jgi:hypothetical protein
VYIVTSACAVVSQKLMIKHNTGRIKTCMAYSKS